MSEGYQVIESDDLAQLVAKDAYDEFSIAILSYVAEQLNMRSKGTLSNLRFEVIRVQYISKYPAIGVQYLGGESEDKEEQILMAIAEILQETSLRDFVRHILTQESWRVVIDNLLDN